MPEWWTRGCRRVARAYEGNAELAYALRDSNHPSTFVWSLFDLRAKWYEFQAEVWFALAGGRDAWDRN